MGGEPVGFILEMENGFKIWHMGDTGVFGDMRLIGEMYRPDVVLLAQSARVIAQLESLGLKVIALEPRTHADVRRVTEQVAQLLGVAAFHSGKNGIHIRNARPLGKCLGSCVIAAVVGDDHPTFFLKLQAYRFANTSGPACNHRNS